MEKCFETSAHKIQTPDHHLKERIQQEHLHYKMAAREKKTLLEYVYTAVCISVPYEKHQAFCIRVQEHAVGYRTKEFLETLLPGEINIK